MLGDIKKVHFIGIGGYGMSALAKVLIHMGTKVSGSDLKSSNLTHSLESLGADIFIGHNTANIKDVDLAVYSTAIPEGNSELKECKRQGITLWHRSDLLAKFINSYFGIAVAGTHGKTTTTSMISLILQEAGLDPTALVGGEVANFKSNARFGRSQYLVAEACESDHSFLRYYPMMSVLTNIEPDHLEYYDGDFSKLVDTYKIFLEHIDPKGVLVYCADDENAQKIKDAFKGEKLSYSLEVSADYKAVNLSSDRGNYKYDVVEKGKPIGTINLSVPGKHNVYNSLGGVVIARKLGIDFSAIKDALVQFQGAKRRFQVLGKHNDITVVDDYAHHPTEVKATLEAARDYSRGRVVVVFQPHRYSRLSYFIDDFAQSFTDADITVLHDVYSAGEKPIEGINSIELKQKIEKLGKTQVCHFPDHTEIINYLKEIVQKDDTVLFLGAGDISGTAYKFEEELAGDPKV